MLKKLLCTIAAFFMGLCVLCACDDSAEKQGAFYSLGKAYEFGYLTKDDLLSVAYYNNGGRAGNENLMGEDYAPKPKTPEALDKETDRAVRQTYRNDRFSEDNPDNVTAGDIVYDYYGTYNDCVVVKVKVNSENFAAVVGEETVDGVQFIYGYADWTISVWVENGDRFQHVTENTKGTFYSLQAAYDNGYLSERDLKQIASYYNSGNSKGCSYPLGNPVKAAIKNSYAEKWNSDERNTKATAADFTVAVFWGYYNDCCVVDIESWLWNYPAVPVDEWRKIGGVEFHVTSNFFPMVWKLSE